MCLSYNSNPRNWIIITPFSQKLTNELLDSVLARQVPGIVISTDLALTSEEVYDVGVISVASLQEGN